MELYQKKRYLQNQGNKGLKIKYNKGYNPLNKEENIYLQKMLEQNKLNKLPNENITNIITNMENILSNENNFKRAMKYVSSYNKNYQNDKFFYRNTEKSASPLGRRTQYKNLYENTTPLRKVLNITRQPLIEKYNNTKNIDVGNDVYFTKINNKNKNNDECYDIEISSINDNGIAQSKSPEEIKYKNKNIKTEDNEDDIKELIITIEDLQSIINGQKFEIKNLRKENRKKEKEINYLGNEVDNLKKELEEKTVERDKDIENIFNNNDSIKLKNEYFKLLKDYDDGINDYNNLKDEYNKMVDEYNNIKKDKNKLLEESKKNKINNNKIKEEFNKMQIDAYCR